MHHFGGSPAFWQNSAREAARSRARAGPGLSRAELTDEIGTPDPN